MMMVVAVADEPKEEVELVLDQVVAFEQPMAQEHSMQLLMEH